MENNETLNSGNANESVVTDVQATNVEQNINDSQTSKTNDDDIAEFEGEELEEIETKVEDTNEMNTNESTKTKSKPTKEQSRIYAQQRREREKKEKEERYNQGLKDALKGINPYTQDKIEDDADLEVYKEMLECENAGFDPITEFHKFQADKKRKAIEAQKKELEESKAQEKHLEEQKKFIDNDLKSFNEKYPNIDTAKLFQDERFKIFSRGKIGVDSLAQVYEEFMEYENGTNEKAKSLAIDKYARVISSPGSLSNSSTVVQQKPNWKTMSREEFMEYWKGNKKPF